VLTRPYQPGECLRIRDERWRVVDTDAAGTAVTIAVVGCGQLNAGIRAVFVTDAERVARLPSNHRPRLVRASRWRLFAGGLLAAATPRFDALRAAAAADITLIPFQLEPALAMTRGLGCRMLIADEVGLGKTIQAGLVIAETLARVADGHALVVAPAALRYQWLGELQQRFHLPAVALDAASIANMVGARGTGINPWAAHRAVIVSIDYIKRPEVLRALESLVWDIVVFDEAHMLAGVSERAAAAQRLSHRAHTLLFLTATPHSGDSEAFSRLTALGRLNGTSPPLLMFRRSRRDAGLPSTRRTRWLAVRTTAAEHHMHHALLRYVQTVCRQRQADAGPARLAMSILLKRGCSSAASLARSCERRLALLTAVPSSLSQLALPFDAGDDEEPLGALAVPGLSDSQAERDMLATVLDLARRAAASESKIDALRRLIRRQRETSIVFTEYRDTLEHLARSLDGEPVALVHGALTPSERRDALQRFTQGPADILLATDAASEGLNLQHRCRRIINMELPWNPLRLEQRIGRVDRIGQQRIVHATHLVARGTAEDAVVARLLARMSTADSTLSGLATRTEDDIISAVTSTPPSTQAFPFAAAVQQVDGIVMPDLRKAADAEAGHLALARRLTAHRTHVLEGRPVIARLRGYGRSRRVWAMRLSFADGDACIRWSTLIGITADGGPAPFNDLRRTLDPWSVSRQAHDEMASTAARLTDAAARFALTAIARDDEILAILRATRGQLVPRNRGLFDRREERAAAAQLDILGEALERCQRHRLELTRLQQLTLTGCELVFGVAIE
jgi:superfamily II DNA or RNA helicase